MNYQNPEQPADTPLSALVNRVHCCDALELLRALPDESVNCIVTSPPYFNLRDYGVDGQIGLEQTPDDYVARLVAVFREAWRVLRSDGIMFINMGDSYVSRPQNVISCGTCGKGQSNYPAHDYFFENLCDGCLSDLLNRKFRISRQPAPKPNVLLSESSHERKGLQPDHLPTLDSNAQVDRISFATQDQGRAQAPAGGEPLFSQESTNPEFYQQSQDGLTQDENLQASSSPLEQNSSFDDVQESAHMVSVPGEKGGYILDSVAPFEEQRLRNQYTSDCCSLCGSYAPYFHTDIKAHCTTCENNIQLPSKSLLGIPWRVAFGLQDDGWILRSEIVWHKPNPMPESVTDRPTKAHEQVFLLTKNGRYWYDAGAIAEVADYDGRKATFSRGSRKYATHIVPGSTAQNMAANGHERWRMNADGVRIRNKRSVWTVATEHNSFAHFATFPRKLIEPMILAGCPVKVCHTCGAPWVREVEKETFDGFRPTCTCNVGYACTSCDFVLEYPYDNNTHVPNLRKDVREPQAQPKVLQHAMPEHRDADGSRQNLSDLPKDIPPGASQSILLQQEVCVDVYSQKSPEYNRQVQDDSRVHSSLQAEPSELNEGGLHHGTPLSDGGSVGQVSNAKRSGSSRKRKQSGQQTGKSASDGQDNPRQTPPASMDRHVSVLRPSIPHDRTCPRCGGALAPLPAPTKPGIVLDMFMGSGTTALVARQHGRQFIGCDLNPEYVALARERLAQPYTPNMFLRKE